MMTRQHKWHPDNFKANGLYKLKTKISIVNVEFKRMFVDDEKKLVLMFESSHGTEMFLAPSDILDVKDLNEDD